MTTTPSTAPGATIFQLLSAVSMDDQLSDDQFDDSDDDGENDDGSDDDDASTRARAASDLVAAKPSRRPNPQRATNYDSAMAFPRTMSGAGANSRAQSAHV